MKRFNCFIFNYIFTNSSILKNSYAGLSTSPGIMSRNSDVEDTEVTITGNQTFHAVYSSEFDNYYYAEDEFAPDDDNPSE